MSEPSGDSPDPSPAPSPKPTPQNSVTRAPRANPPSVFNPRDVPPAAPEVPGAPPGFAEFMAWMQNLGGGASTTEEGPAGRPLISKEQKKFSRRPAESPAVAPAPTSGGNEGTAFGEADSSLGEPPNQGADRGSEEKPVRNVPRETFNLERKRRSKDPEPKSPLAAILMQLLVFGLIVASFFFGRATVPKTTPPAARPAPAAPGSTDDSNTPGILPNALQDKVDEAFKAESNGDFKQAEFLLEQVREAGGRVYGLVHHLGELAFFAGDTPRAMVMLNDSIAANEKVAASYNLRGLVAGRAGVMSGTNDLVLATKLDPFDARFAFYAGEAFRRQGKPQTAVTYLRQAVYRLHEGLLEGFYNLKLRLALLEAGQEKEFADEMAANLALSPPPLDWLFTAAAAAMHRGDVNAAAGYLDKARSLASQDELDARLRDYYFFSFSEDKVLARFFTSIKTSHVNPPLPPASTPTASGPAGAATPEFLPTMTSPAPIEPLQTP